MPSLECRVVSALSCYGVHMAKSFKLIAIVWAFLAAAPAFARADDRVDLLLVLAADVSRSVDHTKFQLQRDGYAAALTNPRVLEAIQSGKNRRIGVAFVEWSGAVSQKLVVDWAAVGDLAAAEKFGAQVREAPRSFADRTSISGGIDFAISLLERSPFLSERRTIDVSGDGTNNSGRDVVSARDEAVRQGVTINGLAILSETPLPWNPEHTHPPGGLVEYYRKNVIGGPGAFVIAAENFETFGKALISKLVAEIAGLDPAPADALRVAQAQAAR